MVWRWKKKKTGDDAPVHPENESHPDFDKHYPRERLPKELQELIDRDDDDLDALYSQ
jgi:hypothetical protein